ITAGVMEVFKFGFLFIGNEYFHDGYPEPHLGENQAVSMSTGINLSVKNEKKLVLLMLIYPVKKTNKNIK
ncbi:hypothetical protein, partial [Photorhabdus stackebrandtii]|uniref:hypothetical protein n=1 Tax=Photorhabdus stackebrandtii TaxID=1123042 RepID=UPI001A988B92